MWNVLELNIFLYFIECFNYVLWKVKSFFCYDINLIFFVYLFFWSIGRLMKIFEFFFSFIY